jgi:predicted component of type VI protein secretion system
MSEYRLSAQLGENVHLHVATENLEEMGRALMFFGLANLSKTDPRQQELPLEPTEPAPAEEPKAKKTRKAAATPAVTETAQAAPVAAEPVAESPSEGNAAAEASTPVAETASAASFEEPAPSATPAQAAEAVRAFGARFGITAARELLQRHGCVKTADITADKAGAIVAEVSAS